MCMQSDILSQAEKYFKLFSNWAPSAPYQGWYNYTKDPT